MAPPRFYVKKLLPHLNCPEFQNLNWELIFLLILSNVSEIRYSF